MNKGNPKGFAHTTSLRLNQFKYNIIPEIEVTETQTHMTCGLSSHSKIEKEGGIGLLTFK